MTKKSESLVNKILAKKKNYSVMEAQNHDFKDVNGYTDFAKFDKYKQIQIAKNAGVKFNLETPFFREYEGIGSNTILHNGKEYINFSSYNYISLNGSKEAVQAVDNTMRKLGTSVSASRLVSGERAIHIELEKEIANLYETEDSVAFVSGHATNVSTISTLFEAKDLIVYDETSHNSIIQGLKLSDAKAYAFRHNDYNHLEALLSKYRSSYNRVLIVIEGLYSMDGDVPNLPEFIKIKNRYSCFLMIDEAHSLGVLGDTGKGIFEYFSISPSEVDIWMGTLSKTLCSCGGYIAGTSVLIEILKCHSSSFVYSVGISPMNAAAALASLKLLKDKSSEVVKLQKIGSYMVEKLKDKGFNIGNSIGYGIIPVIFGKTKKTIEVSLRLFKDFQVNVNPVIHPAVEERKARLRFFINSSHTVEQIDYTVDALVKCV